MSVAMKKPSIWIIFCAMFLLHRWLLLHEQHVITRHRYDSCSVKDAMITWINKIVILKFVWIFLNCFKVLSVSALQNLKPSMEFYLKREHEFNNEVGETSCDVIKTLNLVICSEDEKEAKRKFRCRVLFTWFVLK